MVGTDISAQIHKESRHLKELITLQYFLGTAVKKDTVLRLLKEQTSGLLKFAHKLKLKGLNINCII